MKLAESIKMAVTTLTANRLRSGLTMLGIVIGNASVIALVGVGQGAQKLATEQLQSLGPNVLFVIPGSPDARNRRALTPPKTLVLADAEVIAAQVPSVKAVAPEINSTELITYRNKNSSSTIVGTTPEFLAVRSFDVAKGRFLTDFEVKRNHQVAVLGADLAEKLFEHSDPIGQQIRIKNAGFLIIGVMQPKGSVLGTNHDDTAFVPITTMANRIVGQSSPYGIDVTSISVSAKDDSSVRAARFQITNLLRLRHQLTDTDDFTVQTQKHVLEIANTVTGALTMALGAIAGISLLVGGIGIMNIMLVSVTERTPEIGLRKAMGACQQDILTQFLIESIVLSVAGGLIGTGIGMSGTLLISVLTPLKPGVSPSALVLAVGVSGGIGILFGVLPARRAAQLDPIVALRST